MSHLSGSRLDGLSYQSIGFNQLSIKIIPETAVKKLSKTFSLRFKQNVLSEVPIFIRARNNVNMEMPIDLFIIFIIVIVILISCFDLEHPAAKLTIRQSKMYFIWVSGREWHQDHPYYMLMQETKLEIWDV